MRVSAKVDYAIRAAVELAAAQGAERPVTAEKLARAQSIPVKFLENILQGMRQAGVVESRRGPEGGHLLARPAEEITLADVIRAIDGPLAAVGGRYPEDLSYSGTAEPLLDVWIAVRVSLRRVLERVTLADVASGHVPEEVGALTRDAGAWSRR